MAKCRYFPECQRCNEVGDLWIPCMGGADGTRCDDYEPMPDVDALEALAKVLHDMGEQYDVHERYALGTTFNAIAARIRKALGVES